MSSSHPSTEEQHVQRTKSLKARLRNISGRRKTHFKIDGEGEATNDRRLSMDDGSTDRLRRGPSAHSNISHDHRTASPKRSTQEERGRTQGRPAIQNPPGTVLSDGKLLRDDQVEPKSVVAQTHVAIPVLSMPTITSSDYTSLVDTGDLTDPVLPRLTEDTNDASLSRQSTPVNAAPSGFLSSMLNAATNLSSALGAGASRSPPTRTQPAGSDRNSIAAVSNPVRTNSLPEQIGVRSTPETSATASLGQGELSLKDMGLTESAEQGMSPGEIAKQKDNYNRAKDTSLAPSDNMPLTPVTKALRSGSATTMQIRRRRGSTTVSVFGAETQGQKITGFAVASNKRNREFHATFRSVPDADYLLDGTAFDNRYWLTLIDARLWLCSTKRNTGARPYVCI